MYDSLAWNLGPMLPFQHPQSHMWNSAQNAKVHLNSFLIHEADPQKRPIVIIVSAHVRSSVRPSVPTFHKTKQIFQAKATFTTDETVGLAEWIIYDTLILFILQLATYVENNCQQHNSKSCFKWLQFRKENLNCFGRSLKYCKEYQGVSFYVLLHAGRTLWAKLFAAHLLASFA